ncbi:MAG: argininosuccinate lyase [Kiritimatiellaeota bacterium]|nr:argininosuccinate lyase [Kiritimatiellota bacterium]
MQKTIVGKIDPDVLAFTVGKDPVLDLDLAVWDCYGTAAHVTMLSKTPNAPKSKTTVLTADERKQVILELANIIRDARAGAFTITAADQDVHLAVERRLTEKLGDLGRKVHTGRSRNDQVAVDIRLHIRDQLLGLMGEAVALAESLVKFGKRHAMLPMVGRTHLQPAMPSTVGLWATGYAEAVLDDLVLAEAAYTYNDRCPLGSAAGYGVPLNIDRELTARLLGFSAPHHNVFHASNTRGKNEAILLSACGQVMLTLSRLAEDLILFSMPEFGYFALPKELCTGSSIMPQKNNPDVLELIRAKTAVVLGLGAAANTLLKAMPGGYNRDLQESKELYMEGLRVTRASLRIMKLMADKLSVNEQRLYGAFRFDVFATDYALDLVASGTPFREAYEMLREDIIEHPTKTVIDSNGAIALENCHDDESGDYQKKPDAKTINAHIAAKTHLGGTAGLDFDLYKERIRDARQWVKRRTGQSAKTLGKLLGDGGS